MSRGKRQGDRDSCTRAAADGGAVYIFEGRVEDDKGFQQCSRARQRRLREGLSEKTSERKTSGHQENQPKEKGELVLLGGGALVPAEAPQPYHPPQLPSTWRRAHFWFTSLGHSWGPLVHTD